MMERVDPRLLIAYADGELAGAERRAVEQYVVAHPEARRVVETHRRLTRAAQRAVRADTPPVPRELRAAVEGLLADESESSSAPRAVPSLQIPAAPMPMTPARAGTRWLALAAAAAVVLVVGTVALVALNGWGPSPGAAQGNNPLVPPPPQATADPFDGTLSAVLVAEVTRVHIKCSRILDHFLSPEFGRTLAELPEPAGRHLGRSGAIIPDLSSMNYDFEGAGPCNIPGARTLHLLYRDRTDADRHVSLFIQPDSGQLKVEADVLHTAAGPDAQHPMLVWRSGGMIYYVVGDSDEPTVTAAAALSGRL